MKAYPVYRSLGTAALCFLLVAIGGSCAKVVTLPTGPITISGVVNDANGLPLVGKTVRLSHGLKYIETTTDAKGAYSFPTLATGSYTVRPKLEHCKFLPRRGDLDRLKSSTVQDFGGYGPACGGEPTVNMGAMTGPFTVSGHIRDAAGTAVVGARIDMDDDDHGIRFTNLTGGFAFHVRRGEFKLRASGACAFTPAGKVRIDVKTANAVQDFTAGPGCVTASKSNVTPTGSVLTVEQGGVVLGRTYVRVEERPAPVDALARLSEIIDEQPATPPRTLTIAGNPAIERQASVSLPGPAQDISGSSGPKRAPFLAITTAIAVGNTVVRFESQLAGNADTATIARFLQVGRNFTPDQIPDLHGAAPAPNPTSQNIPGSSPVAPGISATGVIPGGSFGELQVAASDTANVIVYGTPTGPFRSTNGGQTVQASTFNTVAAPPAAAFVSLGDPTVAVGAPNASFAQTIYYAQLQQVAPAAAGAINPTVAIGLYQSVDNGATFNNVGFPRNCSVAAQGCVVPDQEQLAADRINRATPATGGSFDQLYLAWRNFTSATTNAQTIAVACSQDNGQNWNVDLTTLATTGASFPRIAVGPDGTLIAAYSVISGATYRLRVQTWGSCASGFRPGNSAVVANTVTEVTDMAGIDRPPQGNYAPSWESPQRVYVVYSNEASAGNDDIHVALSTDAGKTWTRDSIVSTNGTGRKYFPWICSTVGKNFVAWYDRRGSSAANPDSTAYYRASVFDNGSTSSVGIGPEVNVSGVNDAQCLPGFPNQVRGAVEQTGCTNLPPGFIQGGTCQFTCAPGAAPPCGSGRACDFRAANPCPPLPPPAPAETCVAGNNGVPKYGDYNGAACALGTFFVAWASATPAVGAACLVNGLPSATAAQCCSGVLSGGTCAASAAACVANGGACGPGAACCSATAGGRCQAGVCMPGITMYTGSSCIGPGCAGVPVKITYHQTGACNGFVPSGGGIVSAGPNAAYVIFGIERIDNALGASAFNFDPDRLYVQQAVAQKLDSNMQVYPQVLGPFAVVPSTIPVGTNRVFATAAQGATVVTTTNANGAVEANQTAYFLQYDRQPTDPQITLVKSDASRTSWPLTLDCKTIVLK